MHLKDFNLKRPVLTFKEQLACIKNYVSAKMNIIIIVQIELTAL